MSNIVNKELELEELAEVFKIAEKISNEEKSKKSGVNKEIVLQTDIYNVSLSLEWQGEKLLSTIKINGKKGD